MFLGTHYEVTISCEENDWIAHSDDFMEDGEEVGILVDPDKMELTKKDDEADEEPEKTEGVTREE